MKPVLHLHPQLPQQSVHHQAAVGGLGLSKGHRLMTSKLLLLGTGVSSPVSSVLMPLSFLGNKPREGGGPAQGHTGVWTGAAMPPCNTLLGPGAPNPQAGRLQRPRGPRPRRESDLPLPPSPSPRAAPSKLRGAPPSTSAQRDLSLSCPRPPPQEFNPLPAEGRPRAQHAGPTGPQKGVGRPGEGEDPSNPSTPSQRAGGLRGQRGQVGG